MQIRFTRHAVQKSAVLKRHGISISRRRIIRAVEQPDLVDYTRLPLLIAQTNLDERRVLRVVYRIEKDAMVIITFYPGRKSQYEKEN
ncbi:MAG: hypothetical protein UY63_C0018G0018 [Parcubacteria group bacterium GW2011_GWA2_51_10]|nr:MAG: hypothetical protein UY63_C0018G0018 [Parcubacteria group bacterium GW2011_GWA2_51_10]